MKVLIIDDERFNLAIAKDFVKTHCPECDVILCNKPTEVMDILRSNNIDVILLDIVMPQISGIEVLKEIRSHSEFDSIQILMLTSQSDQTSFKRCFEIGADDYIRKPIDIVEFAARLNAAIKTRNNGIMLQKMLEKLTQQNIQLKNTQSQMLQKEKMASIGELAAGIAHEINNPIGFVSCNLETLDKFCKSIIEVINAYRTMMEGIMLRDADVEDSISSMRNFESQKNLEYIIDEIGDLISDSHAGIKRVTKIVHSLRSFARTDIGDSFSFNNLNEIIEEALLITNNEHKYSITIEKDLQEIPEIMCNRGQIGQVLVNIVINGSQAIKKRMDIVEGLLIIRTYATEDSICCSIVDNGHGIPQDIIDKIFDPFFTTRDVGEGTGLGLSIAYDIINKKHNGKLLVSSKENQGTEFIIKLPIVNTKTDQSDSHLPELE